MKYRIITNGLVYRIQRKFLWIFWRSLPVTSYDRDGKYEHFLEYNYQHEALKAKDELEAQERVAVNGFGWKVVHRPEEQDTGDKY